MKVLISFAPGDRSFAYTLPVLFARDEVILEPHSLDRARDARMRAAVEACDRFVAVLTARYLDSRECEAEWRHALSLGKAISGLLLESCTPPSEFTAAAELIDVSGAWRGYLGALASAVAGPRRGSLPGAPAPTPAPSRPTATPAPAEPPRDSGTALLTRLAGALAVGGDEAALAVLKDPAARNAPELSGGRRRWLESGIQALRKGDLMKGVEALDFLAGVQSFAPRDRAGLLLRGARLRLVQGDVGGGLAAIRRAEDLDGKAATLRAAYGEYFRRQGDAVRAAEYFNAAPSDPAALVGLGLLAEANGDWTRADTYYAEAIALLAGGAAPGPGDLLARLGPDRLGTEATGNLYLQAARALRRERPADALRAVEIALDKGVRDDTAYPERVPLRLKAELLESLDRPAEAAEAFLEAGKRFNWLNQHLLAVDMLDAAHRLHSDHAEVCWYLANSLLMISYTQEPPYYREEPLRRSMAVWEQGMSLALPDADQSWVYTLRAFQLEMATALPDADRLALYWEAVAMLERGITLDPGEVNRWHILGRTHRNLLNEAASMQAVRRSVELEPDNLTILEEAVIVLTNAAEFDEVAPLIDRYARLAPEAGWATAVRAFVTLRRGDAQTALHLTERAFEQVEEKDRQPWFYELRADVYRKLGQPERAAEAYRWLWAHRDDPRFPTSATSFGWAAFYLGMPTEAIPYLERGLRERTELPAGVHISLGLCYFALGETARGESELMDGVAQMVNGREVGQFLDLDYPDALRFSQSWPHGDTARAALDRARQTVLDHRAEIEAPDSPLDELEAHRRDAASEPSSWRAIGATAALARLYPDAARWTDALDCCRDLRAHADRFPEAPVRLEKTRRAYLAEAQRRAGDGNDPAGAATIYEALLAEQADDPAFRGELQARLGVAKMLLEDRGGAAQAFEAALAAIREGGAGRHGEWLGTLCRDLVPDAARYWALQAAWIALAESRPDLRADLDAARQALSGYLEQRFQMGDAGLSVAPGVPPIVLELAPSLIPADTSPEWPLRKTHIPALRERIQRDTGVTVPGVLIRENEGAMPPGAFAIALDDVPVLYETLPDDLAVQADPLPFIVGRLEGVLRQNLAGFLGFQEVEFLLDAWKAGGTLVPDAAARRRIARVLRALVWEGVPLTRPADILAAVEEVGLSDDIDPLLRAIRLRLKDLLPVGAPRAALPEHVEAALSAGITPGPNGGRAFLALEPDTVQQALEALRKLREEKSAFHVLVVRDPALRPHLKGLVEYELPGVQILAQEELEPTVQSKDVPDDAA